MSVGWRDHRSTAQIALGVLPTFPMGKGARRTGLANSTVLGSPSARHAATVWNASRVTVARRSWEHGTHVADVVELAMVAELADHLGGCARCWRTGPYDSQTPVAWLTYAVSRRPRMREALGAAVAAVGGGLVRHPAPRGRGGHVATAPL